MVAKTLKIECPFKPISRSAFGKRDRRVLADLPKMVNMSHSRLWRSLKNFNYMIDNINVL
jgi:hypothetical protein